MSQIIIRALRHRYAGSESEIQIDDREIKEADHVAILGKSGTGKSTLLHLLAGMMRPYSGQIIIDNTEITQMPGKQLDRFRAQHIGLVFQKPHLVASLTVWQNLQLVPYFSQSKIDEQRIDEIMARLDIKEIKSQKPHQISQGQAQRVAIARAILHQPKVILADEPTSSLDDQNCEKVVDLLKDEALRIQATLLIATHDHRVKEKINTIWQL